MIYSTIWALSWIGWRIFLWDVHYLHFASPTACSLSTLVIPQCNPCPQCVTVHPMPKFRSCHKAIMVITGWAHCNPLDIFNYNFSIIPVLPYTISSAVGLQMCAFIGAHTTYSEDVYCSAADLSWNGGKLYILGWIIVFFILFLLLFIKLFLLVCWWLLQNGALTEVWNWKHSGSLLLNS